MITSPDAYLGANEKELDESTVGMENFGSARISIDYHHGRDYTLRQSTKALYKHQAGVPDEVLFTGCALTVCDEMGRSSGAYLNAIPFVHSDHQLSADTVSFAFYLRCRLL